MFVTPSTLPAVGEDVDLDLTFNVNTNIGDPAITSVSATCSALGNVAIVVGAPVGIDGNTTITVSGRYNDNFDKSITYEDGNKAVQSASRFKDIAPGYNFVSEYVAASGGTVTATYTVIVNGTPFTITQTINNTSFTPGQKYLVQYVAQGKY
jgi:hypothetical protein